MAKKRQIEVVESLPTPSAVDALAATADKTMPVDWKALDDLFWKKSVDYSRRYAQNTVSLRDNVQLGEAAWEQLQRVIAETPLPVTLGSVSYGFTVGMVIWTEARELYPHAFERSEHLFTVEPHILPGCPQASFDWAWETLSPIVQQPENIELLKRCNLDLPQSKAHYAY